MKTAFYIFLLIINLAAFCLYGADKKRARDHAFRIPERVLLITAFFGGAAGALLGMLAFRHKTRKARFLMLVPLFLFLQIAIFLFFVLQ